MSWLKYRIEQMLLPNLTLGTTVHQHSLCIKHLQLHVFELYDYIILQQLIS